MHLSVEQTEAVKQETGYFSGARADGWLSGSRGDKYQHGFTLVELVMTMVIIGIIAAVAAPRFFNNNVFQSRGAADQVKAALRYGQKVAIAQHRRVVVELSAGANPICDAAVTASGVSCVISNNLDTAPTLHNVYFDALGRPVDSAGVPNTAQDSIVVGGITIYIEQETGYVHQ